MSAANPKFKAGDILQIGDTTTEYFTVLGFQTVNGVLQYVMSSPQQPAFALDVDFVDANPDWHLKTTPPPPGGSTFPWIWVGVGGAVAVLGTLVFLRMRRPQ